MSWLGRNALSTLHSLLVINKDGLGCPSNLWFIDHLDPALSTASIRVLVINKDGLGCPSKPWFIDHLGSKQLEACFMTAARRKMTVQLKATKKKVKPLDSGLPLHRDGYEDCLSYQARRGIRCYRNFKTAFEGSTFFSYDKKEIEKGAYAILFLRLVASRSNWATDSFTSCFWHWV